MKGLEELREATAAFLRQRGVPAAVAWEDAPRVRRSGAVAVVSLRGCRGGPAGLQDYLGERFDPDTGRWEELYGKRAELTLGLDLYAPEQLGESGCTALFAKLSEALADGGPEGLTVLRLSCGETGFVEREGLFRCRAEAVCRVYLYASADENGVFTDFRIRGTAGDRKEGAAAPGERGMRDGNEDHDP